MDEEAARLRERGHFDSLWGEAAAKGLRRDTAATFRPSITSAYFPGGTLRGGLYLRAYDIVVRHGVAGKDVLDYACGLGKWSVHLAQLSAKVSGFDLSPVAIQYARRRAAFNGVDVRFDTADAAQLPYDDATFDLVVGIGALHHVVKYSGTSSELHRVMRRGALAVFAEVLGHNLLIEAARRMTMRGKHDAGDVILTESLILEWGSPFSAVQIEPMSLLFMLKRVLKNRRILSWMHALDENLMQVWPELRRRCGECVIVFVR